MIVPNYLAVVPTDYEIYAVGATEKEAKTKALRAAREWVNDRFIADGLPIPYLTDEAVEANIGCNVYPLSEFGVGQEG